MNLFVQESGLQHKERNRVLVPAVGGILGAERIQLLLGKIALKTCNTLAALFFPLRAGRKELRVVNSAIVRGVSTIRVFAVDVDETAIP